MDRESIQQKIRYYQEKIDSSWQKKIKLKQQVEELHRLGNKINVLRRSFEEKQSNRKANLSKLQGRKNSIKAIASYYAGMSSLLSGREYTLADNGIGTAKQNVDNKRKKLESQLEAINSNIRNYENKLEYWQHQLRIYKDPEADN